MLKITLHESKDFASWYRDFLSGKIDMDPPYQRRAEIWSRWKRAHLIDSLLNDFDVPKFYIGNFYEMPVAQLNPAHKPYSIIDGKQRFGAIFDFFSDNVRLNKSCICDEFPEAAIGGLSYSELKESYSTIAEKIESFVPTVMNVLTDNERKIEQLFLRLNMGEAATGAEQRNAMHGPVPLLVRELAAHPFFTSKIRFSTGRMQEHNLITKLLLLEFTGHFTDTKKTDLDNFAKNAAKWDMDNQEKANRGINPYTNARDSVFDTLELLTNEFSDRDKLLSSAGNIPVYYWFAKNHPRWIAEIRDFILYITEEVKEAVQMQRVNPSAANAQILSYYTMGRTTNDQSSLDGRYRIFERLFREWQKPRPLRRR